MFKKIYYVRKENDDVSYYTGGDFGSRSKAKAYTYAEAEDIQKRLKRVMIKTVIVPK